MSIQGLNKLEVWKRAKDFALKIYREIMPILPAEEKWALSQQIRRSSISISANIAEGYGRFYYQDNVRFCYIARGSLEETLSHLVFCKEAGFIPAGIYESLERENEPGTNLSVRESPDLYIIESSEESDFTNL